MAKLIVAQKIFGGNNISKEATPSLWALWWNAIVLLRQAFSRESTYMWFSVIVAGLIVRTDNFGVSSIVRALKLRPCFYHALLKNLALQDF
jgi:hypothetical protein